MNFMITGTDGMIGTFLKKKLDKKNKCVMSIDRRSGSDILNLDALQLNPKTQKTDMFYHLAAHCKIQEGIEHPELPHRNNADGIFQVLEFCRANNIPKIMNFSSSRVLSSEENPYTASKKYGELLAKGYHTCYGLEFMNVRPSTVYGPTHDITSRLLTTWIQSALKDGELPIYGDKNKTLDFTYVDDFVDGIMLLTDNWDKAKNKSYNISGENEVKLKDLAELVMGECDGGFVKYYEPETAQPQRVKVDISAMKELGFKPKVNVEEGVKRMVEFYKNGK